MPREKNRFERYQRISDILNDHRGKHAAVTSKALMDDLQISMRQLRSDMDYLKNTMKAPIEFDYRLKGWRYTDDFIYLDKLPMTKQDLVHLQIAVASMQRAGQLKDFSQAAEVFGKIHRAAKRWSNPDPAVVKPVYFDPAPRYEAARHLEFFLDAIEYCRRVEFQYRAFGAPEAKAVVFDPYFLRHYDRRWYVGGFSHALENFVRTFPLERIEGVPKAIGFFHDRPKEYDAETYWQHIYGITVPPGGKVEDVLLEFYPPQNHYFLTTPFFEPFEVVEDAPEKLTVLLRLIPNIDLVRKLGSFGKDVRVLAPESLAERMRLFFEESLRFYKKS